MGGFRFPRYFITSPSPILFSRTTVLTYLCPSVYTVAVQVGSGNSQNFSLQIDTGSSDLVRSYNLIPAVTSSY